MAVTETSEERETSANSVRECNRTFYSPLCLSGYLTPLQRKKLRERRNVDSENILCTGKPVNLKRLRGIKQKKAHITNESTKKQRKSSKERIPQIRCTAAKIIIRTTNDDEKMKRFFKTSSQNRLEKANFTMPLVLKKNVFLDISRCVKKTLSCPKQRPLHNENSLSTSKSSCSVDAKSPAGLTPQTITNNEENAADSCGLVFQSHDSEHSPISGEANCKRSESFKTVSDSVEGKSVFDFDWPSDELLLKRQVKARAILTDLNHSNIPVKQNDDSSKNKPIVAAQPAKLYPIFHIKKHAKDVSHVKSNSKNRVKKKFDSSKNGEQMIIDAGQREIGAKVCKVCNMIYTIGQENDEKLHSNYHNMYCLNLKFPGWKEENVIGEYGDGRVIMVRKGDKSVKLKKIEDILEVANRDLGFPSSAIPTKPDLVFILFISSSKQVAGCVVSEPISFAYPLVLADSESALKEHLSSQKESLWRIGNWYSSSEKVPALCGINRIWVSHRFRRCKVASRMIDCLRCNFIYGHVVGIRELAFTDPSPSGRAFAAAYTGTDNFLVYK